MAQKVALKFMKGLRHVPYEAILHQLRLFSPIHRRIRGNLISMFKFKNGLLVFSMESTVTHLNHTGLRGHAYKFHTNRDVLPAVTNTFAALGMSHFGINYRPRYPMHRQ